MEPLSEGQFLVKRPFQMQISGLSYDKCSALGGWSPLGRTKGMLVTSSSCQKWRWPGKTCSYSRDILRIDPTMNLQISWTSTQELCSGYSGIHGHTIQRQLFIWRLNGGRYYILSLLSIVNTLSAICVTTNWQCFPTPAYVRVQTLTSGVSVRVVGVNHRAAQTLFTKKPTATKTGIPSCRSSP